MNHKLVEFTMPSARPLPVLILADISGSMEHNGKIEALNAAVGEMIDAFAEEEDSKAEIHVAVITFGAGGAKLHRPLTPANKAQWEPMTAGEQTPMGGAFAIAQKLIEDRAVLPRRAFRPTMVLVSDGVPTDDWEGPLTALLNSERASKSFRFAMGIGEDANNETLEAFMKGSGTKVFEAHDARQIKKFFRYVTMTVTTRSHSANPNDAAHIDIEGFLF